ncbi:MAG: FliH/SctL family protein [Steroidobacteraceae bacterium]
MSEPSAVRAGAARIERWQLPQVSGPVVGLGAAPRPEVSELHKALQQAETRGYEAGLARGESAVQARLAALDERARRLDAVLGALAGPLAEIDAELEAELVRLALAVGKQLARRELHHEPAQVIAIVRESLTQLPAAAREVRVLLHPEDAAAVREHLEPAAGERHWAIVEDATLARGGCLVQSEFSRVDALFESRVAAITASALGDLRAGARNSP